MTAPPVKFDWTINVTSIVNLAMLLVLVGTAIASYVRLQEGLTSAHSYIEDMRVAIEEAERHARSMTLQQYDVNGKLNVLDSKLNALKENVDKIEKRIN